MNGNLRNLPYWQVEQRERITLLSCKEILHKDKTFFTIGKEACVRRWCHEAKLSVKIVNNIGEDILFTKDVQGKETDERSLPRSSCSKI